MLLKCIACLGKGTFHKASCSQRITSEWAWPYLSICTTAASSDFFVNCTGTNNLFNCICYNTQWHWWCCSLAHWLQLRKLLSPVKQWEHDTIWSCLLLSCCPVCFCASQVIYTSFGGSSKGLHFNNLIVGLVLLTRGRDEEKAKCKSFLMSLTGSLCSCFMLYVYYFVPVCFQPTAAC